MRHEIRGSSPVAEEYIVRCTCAQSSPYTSQNWPFTMERCRLIVERIKQHEGALHVAIGRAAYAEDSDGQCVFQTVSRVLSRASIGQGTYEARRLVAQANRSSPTHEVKMLKQELKHAPGRFEMIWNAPSFKCLRQITRLSL
jgi:hypothetical protein